MASVRHLVAVVVGAVSLAATLVILPGHSAVASADDIDGSDGATNGRVQDGTMNGAMLQIWKGRREMELIRNNEVVRTFPIVLGSDPKESKRMQGDGRTPVGKYVIQEKHPSQRFHLFLALNYPNIDDAERGYGEGLINPDEWVDIFFANARRKLPPADTRLGGQIGIHGFGSRPVIPVDWTKGCIAVSNEEIEYLYHQLPVGTPVIIHE